MREYGDALVRLHRRALAGLAVLRERMPNILRAVRRSRFDAGEPEAVAAMLEAIETAARNTTRPEAAVALAKEFAVKTETAQRIQLNKQVRAALGVELFAAETGVADHVDRWAVENASLIKSVTQQTVDKVATAATRAVANGTLWPDLAKEIDAAVGFGEKRSRLIARDQVGKLYGQVNAQRQANLGVTHFIWRTANDRRVRGAPGGAYPRAKPSHDALNGERFPLKGGAPDVGLPGEPILCRCYGEPDFSDILGEL